MCVGKGNNIIVIALTWHLVVKNTSFVVAAQRQGVKELVNFKTMHARYDGVLYLLTMRICL